MKKINLLSFSGIIAGVIASLCCIGPGVVLFLGFGSIAAFSVFELYRPYFILVSFILISLAFYLAYRKKKVKCEDGSCKVENASKKTKIGVWTFTLLSVLAVGFPYLNLTTQTSANEHVYSNATAILKINGMDCKGCATGIEGSLASIKGVRKVRVDFETGKAIVEYDNSKIKPSVLIDHVNKNGFKATIEQAK